VEGDLPAYRGLAGVGVRWLRNAAIESAIRSVLDHGDCMMVMGGNVNGGQVYSQWPGLASSALDQGELAISTDYRDVLGEILEKCMGNTDLATVFPPHNFQFPGLLF
jgi:uncharacterized protein (DUF1501 family)